MNRNPYTPPESAVGDGSSPGHIEIRPARGGWLTTFLVLMIVANVLTAVAYFLVVIGKLALPGRAGWVGQLLLLLVMGNICCLIATWKWRRWGLFGLVSMSGVAFVLNLYLGHTFLSAALGFLGLALIIAAAYPKWKHFR